MDLEVCRNPFCRRKSHTHDRVITNKRQMIQGQKRGDINQGNPTRCNAGCFLSRNASNKPKTLKIHYRFDKAGNLLVETPKTLGRVGVEFQSHSLAWLGCKCKLPRTCLKPPKALLHPSRLCFFAIFYSNACK
ncbi:Uncharacterised protein [Helicobacter mustelae]|uniref:hypothetical protein n=1 Tax=Helicobacter mustelae TaxID=217 RepID=UPI000E025AAE|nr:hypothetical protein [Helicobacter mustelae]STP11919.1 Uncharacterised protein [Helicobacter mustelae]